MSAPVACGQCNAVLDERSDLRPDQRPPCPHCGSMARAFSVTASGGIVLGGSADVSLTYGAVTQAGLLLQAVVVPGKNASEGRIIESIEPAWLAIARLMQRDPSVIYQIDDRKWEEIIAGAYKKDGYEEVILTPRSGDHGRDVIAVKQGLWTVRIIDQVKAYKPGHLVRANDVLRPNRRAVIGSVCDERTRDHDIGFRAEDSGRPVYQALHPLSPSID